tara:strand:- start:473 stop:676 length:204 start_codon:yes stop_codon:yes gene_type:complete
VDNKELTLSKKLLVSYKERLEKEIIERSLKLKIPSNICEKIIDKNDEINQLKQAIFELENFISKNLN